MKNVKGLVATALAFGLITTPAYGAGGVFTAGGSLRLWLGDIYQASAFFFGF